MKENHKYIGLVNCLSDENAPCDFYTLNVYGKPCFSYVCETLTQVDCLNERYVVTDSVKIAHLAAKMNYTVLSKKPALQDNTTYVEISGRALFLKPSTITRYVLLNGTAENVALSNYAKMTPVPPPPHTACRESIFQCDGCLYQEQF